MLPFQLRPTEYRQLAALVDQSHDAIIVQRGNALLGLHEGLSASEIADLIDVNRQTIYNWSEAFQEPGSGARSESLMRSSDGCTRRSRRM